MKTICVGRFLIDIPEEAQGVIRIAGPRLSDSFMGKQYALSDDLCLCGCSPPPKLIADQGAECQLVPAPHP